MNRRMMGYVFLALLSVSSWTLFPAEKEKKGKGSSLAKNARVAATYLYSIIDINNLTTWIRADGSGNQTRYGDGVIFPRWTSNVIYQDGYVWGGKSVSECGSDTVCAVTNCSGGRRDI